VYAKDEETISLLHEHEARLDIITSRWSKTGVVFGSGRLRNPLLPAVMSRDRLLLRKLLDTMDCLHSLAKDWLPNCLDHAWDAATDLGSGLDIVVTLMVLAYADTVFYRDPTLYYSQPIFSPKLIMGYAVAHNLRLMTSRALSLGQHLMIASMLDHPGLCTWRINTDHSAVAGNSYGMTALHVFMASHDTRVCDLLISAGADVDTKAVFGMSPLLETWKRPFSCSRTVRTLTPGPS
jgi:hypothetical protein